MLNSSLGWRRRYGGWLALLCVLAPFPVPAATVLGPWTPIFKGIDYSVSTNTPGGEGFPRLQVVHAFRVDLADPDVRLFTTPPISNYTAGSSEVGGNTTSGFLTQHRVQVALCANFFEPGTYYLPIGTPMDVFGLAVSDGVVVSEQTDPGYAASILFDTNNTATVVPTNWPPVSLNGVTTAVTGIRPLLAAGVNLENQPASLDLDPRTGYGVSQDGRYLYLMGVDGRQPGYSVGANYYETAAWLQLLGAHDAVAMDGGGSTLLVMQDSTGVPVRLSQSSAVADSGRERTLGSHLGVYAKPLPGFINEVQAVPDDVTARITWTTVEPATSEVEYGLTLDFGSRSGLQPDLRTNHQVLLSGLTPATSYYFRVLSTTATAQFASSNFFLMTTNYVTTNEVFGLTNAWKFSPGTAVPAGSDWTREDFVDADWQGPGPALLWIASSPNPGVAPKATALPGDPGTGFPYLAYYFRTHFTLTNVPTGGVLELRGFIDDGAVIHVNGQEAYRLRMPETYDASTLATGYPCDGNATTDCLEVIPLPMASLTNLHTGTNVLAVQVHNYDARSRDITFGLALHRIDPLPRDVRLTLERYGDTLQLQWENPSFRLQSAPSPDGSWEDVPGDPGSPFTVQPEDATRFYRLRS